jgi:hypothetical protein
MMYVYAGCALVGAAATYFTLTKKSGVEQLTMGDVIDKKPRAKIVRPEGAQSPSSASSPGTPATPQQEKEVP